MALASSDSYTRWSGRGKQYPGLTRLHLRPVIPLRHLHKPLILSHWSSQEPPTSQLHPRQPAGLFPSPQKPFWKIKKIRRIIKYGVWNVGIIQSQSLAVEQQIINDYKSLVYLYVIDVLSLGVMLPYLRPRKNQGANTRYFFFHATLQQLEIVLCDHPVACDFDEPQRVNTTSHGRSHGAIQFLQRRMKNRIVCRHLIYIFCLSFILIHVILTAQCMVK